MLIRSEIPADYNAVRALVYRAFLGAEHTDRREYLLVEQLRESEEYLPGLSMVAVEGAAYAAHIMVTRGTLTNGQFSLIIAPLAVEPRFQRRGYGSLVMRAALKAGAEQGFSSAQVVGDPRYYSRFGFVGASVFGLKEPFGAVDENFMALELTPGALGDAAGMVSYSKAFFD